MNQNPKHIHIIGICGVATSAIAIAFHDRGWKVTGSDKGFFPPISTELESYGIDFHAGWHPERVGKPDIVMIGGTGTSPSNPETVYAKENNIPVYAYPEILEKYFIKENSIVAIGTWGKTTTSSLLSFILIEAGLNPSYFTGGVSLSHKTGAITDSKWSVVEGDEYQVSISDKRPKFVYYSPTHLLLTSVSWDHADLYPTEESYFQTFTDLLVKIPDDGKIVACIDDEGVKKVLSSSKKTAVTYGNSSESQYKYHSVQATKNGLIFSIDHDDKTYNISSPMFGRFNVENITAAFAMSHQIGIEAEKIIEAIKKFKGIKRRFEKRLETPLTVFDCHAPTPEKASSVLESIKEVYENKIIAIYEPNIGGRQRSSAHIYDNAFKDADTIIIPRLTKLKVAEGETDLPMEGDELANTISKTHNNTKYIEDDNELVKILTENAKKEDVIVFLGSHGFRGMIEEAITSLRQRFQ